MATIHTMGETPHLWQLIQNSRSLQEVLEMVEAAYGKFPLIFLDDTHRLIIERITSGEMSDNPRSAVLVHYLGGRRGKRPYARKVHVNLSPRGHLA